jgi:putative heme-binding domain-containing protein
LVHREIMSASGSTFTSARAPGEQSSEFLASSDNWFRPTTVATGPDGALYIADMYRHVIEHPQWISKESQAKLDLRAGHDKGRIYRVLPVHEKKRDIVPLSAGASKADGLVSFLKNDWQSDLAHWMLLWRNDPAVVEPLESLARAADPKAVSASARVHALWVLHGMGKLKPFLLARLLEYQDPIVRRHAARLVREIAEPPEELWTALSRIAPEPDPQVRLEVAYALGYWKSEKAGGALGRLATADGADAQLFAAVVSSLNANNIDAFAVTIAAAAKDRAPSPVILSGILQTALGIKRPQAVVPLLDALTTAKEGRYAPWQFAALANLLDSLDQAKTNLSTLAASSPELKSAPAKVDAILTAARPLVVDSAASVETRAAAVPLLAYSTGGRKGDLGQLAPLLSPELPREVQLAAITALSRRRDAMVASVLIDHLKVLTPDLRSAGLDVLLSRPEWSTALLDAIENKKLIAADVDAVHRQRLLQSGSNANRIRAGGLFAETTNPDRQKVLDAFKEAATLRGTATKGQAIFAKTCATCHKLGDTGNAVGPDLASVGDKSPEGLLVAILVPNRAVETRYINYIATTKDDQTFTGLLAAESANSITLLGADAKPQTILRSDLKELRSGNTSLMPEGLEANLTPQDLADLIAFIAGPH